VAAGHDADATLFFALSHTQRFDYCFRSMCCLAGGRRGYRHAHCLCSLLLPSRLGRRLRIDFDGPFVAPVVLQNDIDLSCHRRRLASNDDF
jgi:hypothetical protein